MKYFHSRKIILLLLVFFCSIALPPSFANRTPKQEKTETVVKQYKKKRHKNPNKSHNESTVVGLLGLMALAFLLGGYTLMVIGGYKTAIVLWWAGLGAIILSLILLAVALIMPSTRDADKLSFGVVILYILGAVLVVLASIVFLIHGLKLGLPLLWWPPLILFSLIALAVIIAFIA